MTNLQKTETSPTWSALSKQARYWHVAAILLVIVVTVVRLGFLGSLGTRFSFFLYYPAVMVVSLYGGVWAGLLATGLSVLAAAHFFIMPPGIALDDPAWLAIAIFVLSCMLISFVAEAMRRARFRLELEVIVRNRAEEELRASEKKFRTLYETMIDAYGSVDMSGKILEFNSAFRTLTGYADSEIRTLTYMDLTPEKWHATEAKIIQEQVLARGYSDIYEKEYRRKDGAIIPVELRTILIRDDAGNPSGMWAIVRDITERKHGEEELRNSEERLRLALAAGNHGLYDFDIPEGRAVVNAEYETMLGYRPGELDLTLDWWRDSVHPDDRERAWSIMSDCVIGTTPSYAMEYRMRTKAGGWRWILCQGKNIECDRQGKPVRMLGTHTDITERKEAEESLEKMRNILSEGQKIAHLGTFEYVAETKATLWSEEEYRIYGLDPAGPSPAYEEMLAKSIHPDDAALLHQTFSVALQSGSVYELEHRIVRPDGSVRWVFDRAHPYCDQNGTIIRYVGATLDITERKHAEEALKEREELLSLFVENAPVSIAMFDREMRYIRCSRRYVTEFGIKEPQIIGKDHYKVFPNLPEGYKEAHRRSLAGSVERNDEDLYMQSDGHRHWMRWESRPWYTSQGEIGGIILFVEVITETILARRALQQEREFLRKVIDTAPGMIFLKGWDGRFVLANRALCDFYGTTPEGLVGKTDADFIKNAEEAAQFRQDDREVMNTRQEKVIPEEPSTGADGETRWFTTIKVPLINDDGTCDRMLGVAVDITELKRVKEELLRLNAELEGRVTERTAQLEVINRELETFSYSVSHDLRAPLRHVREFSKALLADYGDRLDTPGKDYLRRVLGASGRMERLIGDLLELSHISRRELRKEGVDLTALAGSVASDLASKEPGRRVEFIIAQGLCAKADPGLLRIVIENLLGNSWKFTRKHPTARIEVGAMRQDNQTVYFVRDDGAGFEMANAAKLFGAFQRLHAAKEFEGSGIGLATVARIVNRHGGRVWAEGAVERGATFYFTLPEEK